MPLDGLLSRPDHKPEAELTLGQTATDILRAIYRTERRFKLRDERPAYQIQPQPGSGLVEATFGAYPKEKAAAYFGGMYRDAFRPETVKPTAEVWRKVFIEGGVTPLAITHFDIDPRRTWEDDLVVFVFDPKRPTDLIDLWNLRIESKPVLPVPIDWAEELASDIASVLKAEHRPLIGNPFGVMHHATVEFSRSMPSAAIQKIVDKVRPYMPPPNDAQKGPGPLVVKQWRNEVWVRRTPDFQFQHAKRVELVAKEKRVTVPIIKNEKHMLARIEPLSPDFAGRFGRGSSLRWINTVRLSSHGDESVATLLPFNIFERSWPRIVFGGDTVMVGSEGWSVPHRYTGNGHEPRSDVARGRRVRMAYQHRCSVEEVGARSDSEANNSAPRRSSKR